MNWRKVSLFIAKDHSVIVFLDVFCLLLCLCILSGDNESKILSLKRNTHHPSLAYTCSFVS